MKGRVESETRDKGERERSIFESPKKLVDLRDYQEKVKDRMANIAKI